MIVFPKCWLVFPRAQHLWRTQFCVMDKKISENLQKHFLYPRGAQQCCSILWRTGNIAGQNVPSFCWNLTCIHNGLLSKIRGISDAVKKPERWEKLCDERESGQPRARNKVRNLYRDESPWEYNRGCDSQFTGIALVNSQIVLKATIDTCNSFPSASWFYAKLLQPVPKLLGGEQLGPKPFIRKTGRQSS